MAWDICGKTVLVTGGNTGIGKATAAELLRRGARVVITSRDVAKGERAVSELRAAASSSEGNIECRTLDLASARSIREFAEGFAAEHEVLHVLIHNAGLVLSERRTTEDGLEMTFGVNHMGPFLLNRRLEGLLRRSAPARVVVVASDAHRMAREGLDFEDLQSERDYSGVAVYGESKLANVLFTRELARRLEGSGVTANCLHPGVVASNFTRDGDAGGLWGFIFTWCRPLLKSPARGARTSIHLAASPELEGVSGGYFKSCRAGRASSQGESDENASRLWQLSEELAQRIDPLGAGD